MSRPARDLAEDTCMCIAARNILQGTYASWYQQGGSKLGRVPSRSGTQAILDSPASHCYKLQPLKKMTCTHCRATKHRCDGGDEASGVSCTRCTRMGRTVSQFLGVVITYLCWALLCMCRNCVVHLAPRERNLDGRKRARL